MYHKRTAPLPTGLRQPGDVREQAGDASMDPPKKSSWEKKEMVWAMVYNSDKNLEDFLRCPFASTMDLTKIFEFWQNLETKDLLLALWALVMVLFDIVHECRLQETDVGKYVGLGMNPRRAILWHVAEFMSDAHLKRIRTSQRRRPSPEPAMLARLKLEDLESRAEQTRATDGNIDVERYFFKEMIEIFLQKEVVPKIRLGQWSKPFQLPEPNHLEITWTWAHWSDLNRVAGKFWIEEGWHIVPNKKDFLLMVSDAFWKIVPRQHLKPFPGSVADEAAACVTEKSEESGVAYAEQEDDLLEAEREHNLKKVAEGLSAIDLLNKISWLHTCPNTMCHWHSFVAIMDFCREHIRDPTLHSVLSFMQKREFPSSMRAWSIMPWAALKELERRGQVPRFLCAPTDAKIRLHANLMPGFSDDPGNVNLDLTFYLLCLWEFICPYALHDIFKFSWKDFGTRGERTSEGPMNFRGNVLEAFNVPGGYHAGRQPKPEQASSSVEQTR